MATAIKKKEEPVKADLSRDRPPIDEKPEK